MNLRTLLDYLLGRLVVGILHLKTKINPPMTMTKIWHYDSDDKKKATNYLMWNNTLHYQYEGEWCSFSETIQDGMTMFDTDQNH